MRWFERVEALDRRWLFLAMAIAIVVPLLVPVSMPFRVGPMVHAAYRAVDRLPEGATVLVSVDYDPGAQPELEPFTRAVVRHLLAKRAKVVFLTLWDKTSPIVERLIDEVVVGEYVRGRGYFQGRPHPDFRYGEGYAFLGFKEGKAIVIAAMGQNLRQVFPNDARGTPLSELPILRGVSSLADFALVVNSSAGDPGAREYVQFAVQRRGIPFIAATTAVSITELTPYYPQAILGIVGGMRGSAEYEQLIGMAGTGTSGLNVLTFGQLFIVLAIVVGNAAYFARMRGRRAR